MCSSVRLCSAYVCKVCGGVHVSLLAHVVSACVIHEVLSI